MHAAPFSGIPFKLADYAGLEHNPHITVLSDVVYGGPESEPLADRRLYIEVNALEALLEAARKSPTQRVVLHHAGLRVRRVLDGGHALEVLTIVGSRPEPEPFSLAGAR